MRIIVLLLAALVALCALPAVANATTYYLDAVAGSDDNSGTTQAQAWRSLSKIKKAGLKPGDSVLLKRGQIFRGELEIRDSGTNAEPITVGAYGTGVKPEIWGSTNFNKTADWTHTGGNVWKTANNLTSYRLAFMVIGGHDDANIQRHKSTLNQLSRAGDFYWDPSKNCAYVYATANPASVWNTLEIPIIKHAFSIDNQDHITVTDIVVRYTASGGFTTYNVDNVHIVRCEAHVGGGLDRTGSNPHGNAFNFYNGARNSSIRDCIATQWFDWGIVVEHWVNNATSRSVVIDNCTVETSGGGIEVAFMSHCTSGLIEDVVVTNNVCTDLGYGWAGYGDNLNGAGLQTLAHTNNGLTARDIVFADNIVDRYSNYGADLRGTENVIFTRNILRNGTGDYGFAEHKGAIQTYGKLGGERWTTGVISYNLVLNQKGKAGLFVRKAAPPNGQLVIANNSFINVGGGDYGHAGMTFQESDNYILKNNVVTPWANSLAMVWDSSPGAVVDNNLYFKSDANAALVRYNGKNYTRAGFGDYPAEPASFSANPLLDAAARPGADSPVIDEGVNVTRVHSGEIIDAAGKTVQGTPDMGAFEYSELIEPPLNIRVIIN